jgi:hypothetical protein
MAADSKVGNKSNDTNVLVNDSWVVMYFNTPSKLSMLTQILLSFETLTSAVTGLLMATLIKL